jgi:hypothetical protein
VPIADIKICPPGTYAYAATGSTQLNCLQCREGTYSSEEGAASISTCVECGSGLSSPSGSTSPNDCTAIVDDDCQPGTFVNTVTSYDSHDTYAPLIDSDNSGHCVPCPIGTFSLVLNAENCISCSDGYTSPPGSKNSDECTSEEKGCPPGTYLTFGTVDKSPACVECPVGTYQPKSGAVEKCIECEDGTSSEAGSTTKEACVWSKNCPAGKYYDNNSIWASCEECPENTYNDESGATSEGQCMPCPSDMIASTGSNSIKSCKVAGGTTPIPTPAPTESVGRDFVMDFTVQLSNYGLTADKFLDSVSSMNTFIASIQEIMYNEELPYLEYTISNIKASSKQKTRRALARVWTAMRSLLGTDNAISTIEVSFTLEIKLPENISLSDMPKRDDIQGHLTSAVNSNEFSDALSRNAAYFGDTDLEGVRALDMQEASIKQSQSEIQSTKKIETSNKTLQSVLGGTIVVILIAGLFYYDNKYKKKKLAEMEADDNEDDYDDEYSHHGRRTYSDRRRSYESRETFDGAESDDIPNATTSNSVYGSGAVQNPMMNKSFGSQPAQIQSKMGGSIKSVGNGSAKRIIEEL